jgi:2-polyprenyl-3-methyl-5-hydroxy-6-metoxy-1,4-benzoquinol methylase
MEYITCNLCGSSRSKLLYRLKDYLLNISDTEYNIVKCRDCGLVYVNPRPTEDEIYSFYTEEYYRADLSKEKLLKERESQLLAKYEKVKHLSPGRLLDVGCQKGEFLCFMQQRGWEVKGIEFSTAPPNLFGLDIFHGKLAEAGLLPGFFDLVTIWAVLEHVYHPKEMLAEVHRVLKPGGKVVLLVTNINSIPGRFLRHDDVPRHTTMFSKHTITEMLKSTGFTVDKFYFGNDIFSGSTRGILNYLVKLLAGESLNDIVAQNRTLGKWPEFSNQIKGRDSKLIRLVDRTDIAMTPVLDRLLDKVSCGFIMTVEGTNLPRIKPCLADL